MESVLFIVIVITICPVFDGRNNRAFVGIDLHIKDLGPADRYNAIHPI